MTIAEFSPTAAVVPVVDYEPRPYSTRPRGPARSDTARRRRSPERRQPDPAPLAGPSERRRHAAAFADAALRRVLEVVDRRRPIAQLRPLMDTTLVDAVAGVVGAMAERDGAAVLRRVLVQAVDPDERAFEVAAGYTRGPRRHAVACRIEARNGGWRLVALQIG
jgi:Family of unknown function (DUF6459)